MVDNIKIKLHSLVLIIFICTCINGIYYLEVLPESSDEIIASQDNTTFEFENLPKLSLNGGNFSHYNLSVVFNETTSSVTGNLSVNYYNNDFMNFTRIPFHLFLSGMQYQSRKGNIEILNVTTVNEPKALLTFEVNDSAQLLWVNLESTLEPNHRAFFEIRFHSIIPDGELDRANSHGSDSNQSRIYKFTSFYPMPCVYDEFDGWNVDPYLDSCDPFYHDVAYYNLTIEAPISTIIAASGELIEKTNKGNSTFYRFDPHYPVREVTFAASRDYIVESSLIDGVNISTYYLPKSSYLWAGDALNYAVNALSLFNDTFGFYPYSTLNIVEDYFLHYGMEYPTQVYVSELIDNFTYPLDVKKMILEKTLIHEVVHQWWYNLVGFDQIDWGFLDEGLTCWSVDYYGKVYHGDWEYFQFTKYFDRVRTYYTDEHLPSKINQSTYDIIKGNFSWGFISYYKAPLIFEKISRTIGQDNFTLGLKTFLEQFRFEIALLSDLQHILEEIVDESLDWLFLPWFDNDYLPKYEFTNLYFNDAKHLLTITIEDENELINEYAYTQQVNLLIYDSKESIIYNEDVWISGKTILNISLSTKPVRVRLEYSNDVIVQLSSGSKTYIEAFLFEHIDYIPGYDINILLIFCVLPVFYLTFKFLSKQKKIPKF
jgi:hypothetical protein